MSDESKMFIKEIFNRLNNNKSNLYLLDSYDNSKIIINDELKELIKGYYKSRLLINQIGDKDG